MVAVVRKPLFKSLMKTDGRACNSLAISKASARNGSSAVAVRRISLLKVQENLGLESTARLVARASSTIGQANVIQLT